MVALEKSGYCPQHPDHPEVRSRELASLVPEGCNHAYDLIVRVGTAHRLEHRQYGEIKTDLSARFGLEIPVRTLGNLAREFIAYVQVVHRESVPLLRRDIASRGGYVLHVDGTCEEGSRVLLVCMDSVSGQVLDSTKIGSENTAEVVAALTAVRDDWGTPLATVNDLQRALLAAVQEVFPETPHFVCHFHLAADVGKDILGDGVARLRQLFRDVKLRPKLRSLGRSLEAFATDPDGTHVVAGLLDGDHLPAGTVLREETGLGVVQGLVSWILAFKRSGDGYGFPFDIDYLALYERVVAVDELVTEVRSSARSATSRVATYLDDLQKTLAAVLDGEHSAEFASVVAQIRRDRKVFDAFRQRLRICPKGGKRRRNDEGSPQVLAPLTHKTILGNFRLSLATRARTKSATAKACRIVLTHLDKYWPYLFGHRLPSAHGIVVPRTNNLEEQEFRKVKRGCRRLHGRGRLRRDVNEMPAGAMLLQNLRHADYRKTVYEGQTEEDMARRFSQVDRTQVLQVMKAWKEESATTRLPRKLERMTDLPSRLATFVRAACRCSRKGA